MSDPEEVLTKGFMQATASIRNRPLSLSAPEHFSAKPLRFAAKKCGTPKKRADSMCDRFRRLDAMRQARRVGRRTLHGRWIGFFRASCEKVAPVFRRNDALIEGEGIGSVPKVQVRFSRPML